MGNAAKCCGSLTQPPRRLTHSLCTLLPHSVPVWLCLHWVWPLYSAVNGWQDAIVKFIIMVYLLLFNVATHSFLAILGMWYTRNTRTECQIKFPAHSTHLHGYSGHNLKIVVRVSFGFTPQCSGPSGRPFVVRVNKSVIPNHSILLGK